MTQAIPKKINVGIIGLSADGGWAAMAHYPALQKLPDHFAIQGLTASSMATAQKAAEKYGVPYYSDDAAALAARDDIDLLVVAVKLPQHHTLIEQIAPFGKAIYCEWPLGTHPGEARILQEIAAHYHCRTFIGLQALHSPYIQKLRQIINDPASGRLISCIISGSNPAAGRIVDPRYLYAQHLESGVNTLTIPFAHSLVALQSIFGALHDMHALTACQYPEVIRKDNGETLPRSTIDHVFFQGRTQDGGLLNIAYRGGGSGLRMEIECEHLQLVVTANSGHLQYEPLTIEILRDGQRETLAPEANAVDILANTYRAVYEDLRHGTHTVPNFAHAVAHQQLLADLAAGK